MAHWWMRSYFFHLVFYHSFLQCILNLLLFLIYFLCTSNLCSIFCFHCLISNSHPYQIRRLHYLPLHHNNHLLNFEPEHHKFLVLLWLCIGILCNIFCFHCLIGNSPPYQIRRLHYLPHHRNNHLLYFEPENHKFL